jgi:hypothetical protein
MYSDNEVEESISDSRLDMYTVVDVPWAFALPQESENRQFFHARQKTDMY